MGCSSWLIYQISSVINYSNFLFMYSLWTGMIGVTGGITSTIGLLNPSTDVLVQMLTCMELGEYNCLLDVVYYTCLSFIDFIVLNVKK